jgi:hypothetical protein
VFSAALAAAATLSVVIVVATKAPGPERSSATLVGAAPATSSLT